jgi:AAA15 family ATPase/GTPase
MVLRFSFSNIFSFKEKQIISFEPEPLKEFSEHLVTPKNYGDSEKLLRALAIYGHNSHGKSNMLKVFEFFISFIESSFKKTDFLNELSPFALNTTTVTKPSSFEIIIIIDGIKYRYGFEVNSEKIKSEWLYYAPFGTKEINLFVRNEQEFRISRLWNKEYDSKIESQALPFAVPNVLLFSVLIAQQNEKILKVSKAINSIIVLRDINSQDLLSKSASIYSNELYALKIQNFINEADLGFKTIFDKIEKRLFESNRFDEAFLKNIFFERSVSKFELYTYHRIYDDQYKESKVIEFDFLKKESEGTVKFFIIISMLVYAIKNNLLLVIDELDSKFHSDLLELIIRKFHSSYINDTESQLIFTTHNTVLLDRKLRRDQVLFVEKNEFGESSIRRMHTKKTPVRIDASIEKDYRKGKLGGVSKKLRNTDPNQQSLFD